jgi:uncharacterized coiled-coil protein SlyX
MERPYHEKATTDLIWRSYRMKAMARIRDLENELAGAWDKIHELEHQLDLAAIDTGVFAKQRAQIAELKARIEAKEATLMRIDAALTPVRETE